MDRGLPRYNLFKTGLENLIAGFSIPGGFPFRINTRVPGLIHEGDKLGHALPVAFGAVVDKLELIVSVIIGEGEAETGPTAASVDFLLRTDHELTPRPQRLICHQVHRPEAVLPIIHVNGFKISERTIYGCMDDKGITALFTG